jgi:ABC-type amino acid transport substrate-binding protein
MHTLIPGTLTVLSAYPDPPFDIIRDGVASGFDIELMRVVCGRLSLELRPLAYTGEDFKRDLRRVGAGHLRRGDFRYHDHARALRACAVLAALSGVQSGNRGQSAPNA